METRKVLRLVVLAIAGVEALICAVLIVWAFAPGGDKATAGLGVAYAIIGLVVLGIPAAIAALLARANKGLWLALGLTLAPLVLLALMFGWLSF